MKIISWNINGIRAIHNKNLLVPFIKKYNPDIICFQETKAKQDQSEVDLPDYQEYWNSAEKPGYSGTAIFSKKEPLSITNNFPAEIAKKFKIEADQYGDPNKEGRLITAQFNDFFLVNVYTPNSKRDLSRLPLRYESWDKAFLNHLQNLRKIKPVIFCGDLNVAHTEDDLANPKQNEGEHGFTKEERERLSDVINAGFVDTFREFKKGNGHYTWWTPWRGARQKNIGWRIDYFFVSQDFLPKIKTSDILPDVLGSDHCPILIELK